MQENLKLENCCCSKLAWPELPKYSASKEGQEVCLWPLLHKHMREWKAEATFRGVVMGSLTADPLKPSLRSAVQDDQHIRLLGETGILSSVIQRMEDVAGY